MVTVLMSTYNGELFLKEQLDSIFAQTVDLNVIVRDDGSSDDTQSILELYSKKYPLKWYSGKNLRSARSFWELILNSPDSEYYALSDQDDFWMPEKLKAAIDMLSRFDDVPALYFSQTQLTDADLHLIKTPVISPKCTLGEAMISHNATGCTFVFNHELIKILRKYTPSYFSMHDNWIYRVCLAVGGNVLFDPVPHILYRQHKNNVIGLKNSKWKGIRLRYNRIVKKERERSSLAEELIKGYGSVLQPTNLHLLKLAADSPNSFIDRIRLVCCKDLVCPSVGCNISSRIAILFGVY